MKKIFAIALLAFAFAATVGVSAEVTSPTKRSSSKAKIMEVQDALNTCSDAGLDVDGKWGPATTAAVRAFQKDNGFAQVGYVGPKTAAMLNDCTTTETTTETTTTTTTTTPATEALCPNGKTLASNCVTAPVVASTTTASTTIAGPEGNLTSITKLGSYNNTKVSESNVDMKVYGLEITAKDGDQKIDGLNISFKTKFHHDHLKE